MKAATRVMNTHKAENVYHRCDDFQLLAEGRRFFFVHCSGERVLTDKLGKAIWESLPGNAEELIRKVREKWQVSERTVPEFLAVCLCAGLIFHKNGEKDSSATKDEVPNSKDAQEELISIIIITYNGEKYVEKCFESIQQQTYRNTEIIAIDNASKDKTVAIIKDQFPGVKLLSLKRNRHYAGGINQGLKLARGKYVFVLNQDTELDKDCLLRLYQKIKRDPQAGAVVPMMKFFELRGFINGIGNQINNFGWGTDNFINCVDVGQFGSLEEVPSACFGAVFIRKAALDEVGWMDKAYRSFYEDVDWSLRCWMHGWKIVPECQAFVYHRFGASYPEGKKLMFVVRNRLRVVLKLFQGRVMLGFIKSYLIEDLWNCLSLLRKRKLADVFYYIKGYLSLFLYLPDIIIKRMAFRRKKMKGIRERDILEKNPSFCRYPDPDLHLPEISAAVIRSYYRWHFLQT